MFYDGVVERIFQPNGRGTCLGRRRVGWAVTGVGGVDTLQCGRQQRFVARIRLVKPGLRPVVP